MVSGFDTTTASKKTLTITYEGKTTTYEIEVIEDVVIKLEETNFKYNYVVKDEFVNANLNVTYHSGKTETIPLTLDMIKGFDTTTPGTKTLIISYKNKTLEVEIVVNTAKLTSIKVKEGYKDTYYIGDEFGQATLILTYDNGDVIETPLTLAMIKGFDTSTVGKKTLTITYEGNEIEVIEDVITNIEVISLKNKYYVGTTIDLTGASLKVNYQSGKSENVSIKANMITGFDTATIGKKTLTITYEGKTTTYEIEVIEDSLVSIVVEELKDTYIANEEFTNGKLKVKYQSGKEEIIDLTLTMVNNFSTSTVGNNFEMTITYGGKEIKFSYNVINQLVDIIVKELKKSYFLDEEFSEGLLTVVYADKSKEDLALTLDMIKGFDTSTVGKKTLTITYEGKTTTYEIEVILDTVTSIELINGFKNSYFVGEKLDVSGGLLKATYLSGNTKEVELTKEMVNGFNSTKANPNLSLTIRYEDKTTTYEVEIVADDVVDIEVLNLDNTYFINEGLDLNGASINVSFLSGKNTNVILTIEMVNGFDSTVLGPNKLIINYLGFEKEFDYEIIAETIEKIEIYNLKTKYYVGEELDLNNTSLRAYYNSGRYEDSVVTSEMVSGFDSSEAKEITLTINYNGFVQQETISIVNDEVISFIVLNLKTEYYVGEELDLTDTTFVATYASNKVVTGDLTNEMVSGFTSAEPNSSLVLIITYENKKYEEIVTIKEDVVVAIKETNFKYEYKVGDVLSEDLAILVTYASGKLENVNLTNEMVKGFDTTSEGVKNITITYKDFSISLTINVTTKVLTNIEVVQDSLKTSYYVGEEFVPGKLLLNYEEGDQVEITFTLGMVSGFDTATPGNKEITITYEGKTTTYQIEVIEDVVTKLEIIELQTEYYVGDEFNLGKAKATYLSGKEEEIIITRDLISDFDTSKDGEIYTYLSYKGCSIEVKFNILPNTIEVDLANLAKEYYIGDEFEPTLITLRYANGDIVEVFITISMIDNFDTSSEGTHIAYINYDGQQIEYEYFVKVDKVIDCSHNLKEEYYQGEEFVPGIAHIVYESGKELDLNITVDMIKEFNTSDITSYSVDVYYEGMYLFTYNYNVIEDSIINIEVVDFKYEFYINEAFPENAKLVATFASGRQAEAPLMEEFVPNFKEVISIVGEQTLEIMIPISEENYYVLKYDINVIIPPVESIKVINPKTTYYVSEEFNNEIIEVTYETGTSSNEIVTIDMVSGFDTKTPGNKIITITYEGKTTTYEIEVIADEITLIGVAQLNKRYVLNEEFTNGLLSVVYTSGKTEEIELTLDMIKGFDTSTVGKKTLTITYEGKTTNYEIIVLSQIISDEFVLPDATTLTNDKVFKLMSALEAFAMYPNLSYLEAYEKLLVEEHYEEETIAEFRGYLEIAGVTESDIDQAISLMKDKIAPAIYELITSIASCADNADVLALYETFLSDDNINLMKDIINELLALLDKNQATVIFTYFLESSTFSYSISCSYSSFIEQFTGKTLTEYNDYLKTLPNMSVVTELIDSFIIFAKNHTYEYKDIYNIVDFAYDILEAIVEVNNEDIRNVVTLITKMARNELTNSEIVTLINSVCNILDIINKKTNSFEDITKVLDLVLQYNNAFDLNTHNNVKSIINIIKALINHIDLIINIARQISEVEVAAIFDFIAQMSSENGPEQNALGQDVITISKVITPLAEIGITDSALNKALSDFMTSAGGMNNTFVNNLLMKIISFANLDPDDITNQETVANDFMTVMNDGMTKTITIRTNNNIALILDTMTDEEIYKTLGEYYEFYYRNNDANIETLITPNSTNIILDDNKEIGVHEGYVLQNGLQAIFYYYVISEDMPFEIYNIEFGGLTQHLFYVQKGENEPYEIGNNGGLDGYFYDYEVEAFNTKVFDRISVSLMYKNIFNILTLSGQAFDYEFILDSTTTGLKTGLINFTGKGIDVSFSLPFEYYVIDENNPQYTGYVEIRINTDGHELIYSNDDPIYIVQNMVINEISLRDIHLDYLIVSNDFYIKDELSKMDTSTLGEHEVTIHLYLEGYIDADIALKYIVLDEKEAYQITNIYNNREGIYATADNYEEVLANTYFYFDIKLSDGSATRATLEQLNEYVKKYYTETAEINFKIGNVLRNGDIYTINELIFMVVDGEETLFEDTLEIYIIQDDHYEDYTNITLVPEDEVNAVIVKSYDDVTAEYLINSLSYIELSQLFIDKTTRIDGDLYNKLIELGIEVSIDHYEELEIGRRYYFNFICNGKEMTSYVDFEYPAYIEVVLEEDANRILNINFYYDGEFVIFDSIDSEEFKTILSYVGQIEIEYPTKYETIEKDELLDFLNNNNFNINYFDYENGYAEYTLGEYKGTIDFVFVNTDTINEISIESTETDIITAETSEEEIIELLKNNEYKDLMLYTPNGSYNIYSEAYINYLIDKFVTVIEMPLNNGLTEVLFSFGNAQFGVKYYVFNIEDYIGDISLYLPGTEGNILISDDGNVSEELIINQLMAETYIYEISKNYTLNEAEKEYVFNNGYEIRELTAKSFDIYYNENLHNTYYYQLVTSAEANEVIRVGASIDGIGISYDLEGNPLENETYLLTGYGSGDIENFIKNRIYNFSIVTRKEYQHIERDRDLVAFNDFWENYVTVEQLNNSLYTLTINYNGVINTIDIVIFPYNATVYYGMDAYLNINGIYDESIDLKEFLIQNVTGMIELNGYNNGNNNHYKYYNVEGLIDFFNDSKTVVKIQSIDFNKANILIMYDYAGYEFPLEIKPNLNNYLDQIDFYLRGDNVLIVDEGEEITIDLIKDQLKARVRVYDYELNSEEIASIIDNFVITLTENNAFKINYNGNETEIYYNVMTPEEANVINGFSVGLYNSNYKEIFYDLEGNEINGLLVRYYGDLSLINEDYIRNNLIADIRIEYGYGTEYYNSKELLNDLTIKNHGNNRYDVYLNDAPDKVFVIYFTSQSENYAHNMYINTKNIEPYDQNIDLIQYLAEFTYDIHVRTLNDSITYYNYDEFIEFYTKANIKELNRTEFNVTYLICYEYANYELTISLKPNYIDYFEQINFNIKKVITNGEPTNEDVISRLGADVNIDGHYYDLTTDDIRKLLEQCVLDIVSNDSDNWYIFIFTYGDIKKELLFTTITPEEANEITSVDICFILSNSAISHDLEGNPLNNRTHLIYNPNNENFYNYILDGISQIDIHTKADSYYYCQSDEFFNEFINSHLQIIPNEDGSISLVINYNNYNETIVLINSTTDMIYNLSVDFNYPISLDSLDNIYETIANHVNYININKFTNAQELNNYDEILNYLNNYAKCEEHDGYITVIIHQEYGYYSTNIKYIDPAKYNLMNFNYFADSIQVSTIEEISAEYLLNKCYDINLNGYELDESDKAKLLNYLKLKIETVEEGIRYRVYLTDNNGFNTPEITVEIMN